MKMSMIMMMMITVSSKEARHYDAAAVAAAADADECCWCGIIDWMMAPSLETQLTLLTERWYWSDTDSMTSIPDNSPSSVTAARVLHRVCDLLV